ncbi:MAG: hypothetical protein H6658_07230 [Ardenticatenaceae bacterium]|nr:hypothetical protein [Ardenticatenaceae bacterium]
MNREMSKRPLRHHSFILSLWLEGGNSPHSPPIWRMSLEDPNTSVRRGFKDTAELVRFLEEWTAVAPATDQSLEE